MKERSTSCLIHASIDVNSWTAAPPSVNDVRPSKCPHCGAAGRPSGQPIGMVGHGTRVRQVRGPTRFGGNAALQLVVARRYRCRSCSRTATVIPRGLVARRHYGAAAIAFTLFLVGMRRRALTDVRSVVAPGGTYEAGWPVVRRWLRAIHDGDLFRFVRPHRADADLPHRAERVAATVMGFAPGGYATDEERLYAGIALAA